MASQHLSTDEFFDRLNTLCQTRRQKAHGSIFLTQKRRTDSLPPVSTDTLTPFIVTPIGLPAPATAIPLPPSSPFPDLHPPHPLPILIRATDGQSQEKRNERVKLSTVVQADELDVFFSRYAEICKAGMSGLKKRDRSGRKAKAKKEKKKKEKNEGTGEKGEKKG